jgi:hypothetical protein
VHQSADRRQSWRRHSGCSSHSQRGIADREFVFDDHALILGDPGVVTPGAWTELFARNYWGAELREGGLWRPLPKLLQALAFSMGGRDPQTYWPFAMIGLTQRIAFALVFYLMLSKLLVAGTRRRHAVQWTAAAAVSAFLMHPVSAPVGIPVMGWPDLISTGLILFACWQACARSHAGLRLTLTTLAALLAIASKETGVMTAAILPLAMLAVRMPLRRALQTAAIVGAASLILWAIRGQLLGEIATPAVSTSPLVNQGLLVRLFTAGHLFALSIGQAIVPTGYQVWYDPESLIVKSLTSRDGAIGLLTVMAFGLAALLAIRRPVLRLAIGTFTLAYLPVSNLFVLIGEMRADRFLFLPFAALIPSLVILLVRGGEWVRPLLGRHRVAATITGLVIAAWGVFGAQLASTWSTNRALWEDLRVTDPIAARSHRALINLGNARLITRDLRGAEECYAMAVTQYGSFKGKLGIANVLMAEGSASTAEVRFRAIIEEANAKGDPATASLAFLGLVESLLVQVVETGNRAKLDEAHGLLRQVLAMWTDREYPTQRQQALALMADAEALRASARRE